ncbi:MAG: hypothetical protein LAO51_18110 [Acidobacteriia bacterium]|nr:hypothetical protein [Terriglobia bacterium]
MDVSALKVNQHVSVAALPTIANVTILDDSEGIVAVVVPPRAEETPAVVEAAPEAAAAEPEVIKKGKEASAAEEPAAKEKGAKEKGAKEK